MQIYSLYLISRSGSLLYQRDIDSFGSPITEQNSNDYLVIASNLHGMHAIASKFKPNLPTKEENNFNKSGINMNSNKTGLRCIKTDTFNIFLHQTVTGLKIILITSSDTIESEISSLQNEIYRLYSDYVMKSPFYNLEMPIRIKWFDEVIINTTKKYNIRVNINTNNTNKISTSAK